MIYQKSDSGTFPLVEGSKLVHDNKGTHMIQFSNGLTIYWGNHKTVNNYGQGYKSHTIVFFSKDIGIPFIDNEYTVILTPKDEDDSVITDVWLETKSQEYFQYTGIAHTVNCTVGWVAIGFSNV